MRVEAHSFGPSAGQALHSQTTATVIASFDRSCYLATDHGLICVASDDLYDGPINLLLRASDHWVSWSDLRIVVGQAWILRGDQLSRIDGPALNIDIGAARAWQPNRRAASVQRQKIRQASHALRKFIGSRSRSDGLLDLVLDPEIELTSAMNRAAIGPLRRVRTHAVTWLSDGDLHIVSALGDLLGLGPGLTPSGDDLIAGFMIACHYTGHGNAASDLWHRLENMARERTTPISFAHLSAAGQGFGAAPFHDLLDALVANRTDRIGKTLDAACGVGHCSGLDAVGGLVLMLDAWIGGSDCQHAAA